MNWAMLVCKLPETHKDRIPDSVSIVKSECGQATNELKVVYNLPEDEKKSFAVCSKGLSIQEDQSLELVEWLEVLKALGADKVFIYIMQDLHPNIKRVKNLVNVFFFPYTYKTVS